MKLIIKHYLSLLKESDELDRLLPDLLLSMGIEPITRPQKGTRQYGVDATAVGKDENGDKAFFIFTIKQGDLGRSDWDGTPQSVRPSLNEIKDVFIPTHIEDKYKKLPKVIVLCTGGEKKQEIEQNWSQYVNQNQKPGEIEYDFWGGDKLSVLIEKHLLNENIIPEELRARLRKTLALLSDSDYDLSDYYSILNGLIVDANYGNAKRPSVQKKIEKALRTISLCQNVVYFWSKNEGNIKPAIYCSERTVLFAWEFLRKNDLCENKQVNPIFFDLYKTLIRIYSDYFIKVQGHCYIRNGFSGYGRHHIQECLNIFEHLGFLSTAGILFCYQAILENNQVLLESSQTILDGIKAFIKNHLATQLPCYDGHVIEISETIHFLAGFKEIEFINEWIMQIINKVVFSYHNMGQYFPICSDSFDDLVGLNISRNIEKEKLFELSTLIPILAQWCIALELNEAYILIKKFVDDFFPSCTLQIWYPDQETDSELYIGSGSRTGAVDAPMELAQDVEEMKKRIKLAQKNTIGLEEISSIKHGLIVLPIIASRHYRTPLLPFYWQSKFIDQDKSQAAN